MARAIHEGLVDIVIAADLEEGEVEVVTPRESLLDASRKMGMRDLDYIPVVDSEASMRLVGLLSRADILEAYETRLMLQD